MGRLIGSGLALHALYTLGLQRLYVIRVNEVVIVIVTHFASGIMLSKLPS